MTGKPIVVGVDASDQSISAAILGFRIARAAGATCHLVTAVTDSWAAATAAEMPFDIAAFSREMELASRAAVERNLRGRVPDELLASLVTRSGRPQQVLEDYAHEIRADLIVLGGKHHPRLARWLGAGTAHHLVRKLDVPLLVTGPAPPEVMGVLAAVDLSFAAVPTLERAQAYARLFDARLWALHVVEPVPLTTSLSLPFAQDDIETQASRRLDEEIWPTISLPNVEKALRHGHTAETIVKAAREWSANLVVLGSHGRGWTDRLLLGSTTEQLLNTLPAHILVIPVSRP